MGWNRKTFGELLAEDRPAHEHAVIVATARWSLDNLASEKKASEMMGALDPFVEILGDDVHALSIVEDAAEVVVWWYVPDRAGRALFAV